MIELKGGDLYQWDQGRVVILTEKDAEANEVHFARYCSDPKALILPVKTNEDGEKYADIPNAFLCYDQTLCVWTWLDDKTISGSKFLVIKRARPIDYVYSPTEVLNYEHLKQWMLNQFKNLELKVQDYETLKNKPRIEDVELVGNRKLKELGIDLVSDQDIDDLFDAE